MKYRIVLGLFLILSFTVLAACGGSTAPSSSSQVTPVAPSANPVKVTLSDTTIVSSVTTFHANRPYYFIITNKGHSPHDFIIRQRPQAAPLTPQVNQGILYIVNSTHLRPGETMSFTYVFPQATTKSNVQFTTALAGPNGGGVAIPVAVRR